MWTRYRNLIYFNFIGNYSMPEKELTEAETNIKVIQSVMGHKDIQTTLDIYAEVTDKKKRESLEDLFGDMNLF